MACLASCTLPGVNTTNDLTVGGNEKHAVMELAALAHDRTIPTGWPLRAKMDKTQLKLLEHCIGKGEVIAVERTYALDVVTGKARHLGDRLDRKYDEAGREPTEIVATCDLVVRDVDCIRVVDWKSRERAPDCEENWQMRAAAMGAHAVEHDHTLNGGDIRIEMMLGYMDDGEVDFASADGFSIAGWWHDVFALRERLFDANGPARVPAKIHEGPWCKYCPALNVCPAKTQLALAMLGELDVAAQIVELSAEQAGRVYLKAKAANDIVERVLAAVKLRAVSEPVPLPNGKRLVIQERNGRESLDQEAVEKVFAELGKPLPMKRGKPFTVPVEMKEKSK